MLSFDNVSKVFPSGTRAVDSVNLEIEDGEFVFLVGPSGAGKTTLLRLAIKEIQPTHGSVFFDNWELNKLPGSKVPLLRRKIGYIFQDFKLLQDRTASENISVALEILNLSKKEVEKKLEYILDIVKLSDKANFFPSQLSFGEQQRVSIGRAIAGEAKILLADEPTGNLDPRTSWEILKIINNINKEDKAVVIATHDVDIVNSFQKRVIVLNGGKVVKDEKKGRYHQP